MRGARYARLIPWTLQSGSEQVYKNIEVNTGWTLFAMNQLREGVAI
jgi:hypothetical protein